jgi:hypothetical protein
MAGPRLGLFQDPRSKETMGYDRSVPRSPTNRRRGVPFAVLTLCEAGR